MQFEHALNCLFWEILLVNPAHGPVKTMKVNLSNVLYRINLNVNNITKFSVVFLTCLGEGTLYWK